MTTNQTIDGVTRELLSDWLKALNSRTSVLVAIRKMRNELRALMDVSLTDEGEKPAAQLQGQPVAYDIESAARKLAECMDYSWTHMPEQGRGAMREYVVAIVGAALSGNAEQPAPVAVVLPDREMYCQYLRGVIPDNRLEVEAHKDGWNACLDELKRLNPSL